MEKPSSKGYYVHVGGKLYGARTKQAQVAIRREGLPHAPITRWDGFEWYDTGTVLYPAEAERRMPVLGRTIEPTKKSHAQIKREVDEVLAKSTARGSTAPPRFDPGQRVDIVTSEGLILPGTHTVVDGSRWGLDESRFVRVRRLLHGERSTDDWPIDRVRPRQ